MKLSFCLPAMRTHLWESFYNSVCESVTEAYEWELIMVGPNDPPDFFSDVENFTFVKDFGSPSRCGQIATTLAKGELMMWGSDDGIYTRNSIAECVRMHDSLPQKDAIAVRYTEGRNYSGKPMHPNYWMAHHHPTLRVVPESYAVLMVGMLKLDYFRELGGWDCRFEHLNMNTHDLSFRLQRDGGAIHLSPQIVANHDWNPNEGDHVAVQEAYDKNDLALFNSTYAPGAEREIKIDYDNWKESPEVWERRFGKSGK